MLLSFFGGVLSEFSNDILGMLALFVGSVREWFEGCKYGIDIMFGFVGLYISSGFLSRYAWL